MVCDDNRKKRFPKSCILSLPKYNPGLAETVVRARYSLDAITRLASNENPFGVSTLAEQASGRRCKIYGNTVIPIPQN